MYVSFEKKMQKYFFAIAIQKPFPKPQKLDKHRKLSFRYTPGG